MFPNNRVGFVMPHIWAAFLLAVKPYQMVAVII